MSALPQSLTWRAFLATALLLLCTLLLHARSLPSLLFGVMLAGLALRTTLRYRGRGKVHWLIRLPLMLGLLATVWVSMGNLFGREAGSALLACMLMLKLLETDTRRDARVVVTVSLFLAMCGFLFDQGPAQSALTFAVVVIALATLYEIESSSQRDEDTARTLRPLSREALLAALRLAVFALPFAFACFLFFPRLSSPLWGAPQDAFAARTGLSDTMEPGGISSLALDDTPVMRVTFDRSLPPQSDRYWRGLVLWNFDGRTWSAPNALDGFRQPPDLTGATAQSSYEVQLEPTDQRWLIALDAPQAAPDDSNLTGDFQIRSRKPVSSVLRYRATSALRFTMQADLPKLQRLLGLRLPRDGNPRARALAASWRAQTQDARAIARKALALINEEFIYSLEPPLLADDAVDDFLFDTKIGFCEHYSSAFTFLMRAAGVPARVVVGFQGGYYNAPGNYLIVRRADAHAWSEIWVAGEGWVRIDPTSAIAPERVEQDALSAFQRTSGWFGASWMGRLRDRFDLAGYWWNQAVVQFTALRQRNLLEPLGIKDATAQQLVTVLVAAGLAALAFAAWLAARTPGKPTEPALALWRRFCKRMAAAGVARMPHEGPAAFAARAAALLPRFADAIVSVSDRYIALRYAGSGAQADDLRILKRQVRAFRPARAARRSATDARRRAS